MYAVVSTGGKQLKVEQGAEAVVERLNADVGAVVHLDVLLVADGEKVVVRPDEIVSASVTAEVVEHFKGEKVVVFKFKKRKGYKRLKGHRQEQTRLRITEITLSGGGYVVEAPALPQEDSTEGCCAAVKGTGEPCANKAKPGSPYCGVHAKKHDNPE